MKNKKYLAELRKLQVELCYVQAWAKATGARIIIVFEGRDTAGKGGIIKAISERVSPRTFRWYDYSCARDLMLAATDTAAAPWFILRSDDKKRARLDGIAHILSQIPYKRIRKNKVKLPKRSHSSKYDDQESLAGRRFVEQRF